MCCFYIYYFNVIFLVVNDLDLIIIIVFSVINFFDLMLICVGEFNNYLVKVFRDIRCNGVIVCRSLVYDD